MSLRSVEFKVFGKVQRVFFRKCTKEKADSLGLVGWCKNLPDSTVTGNYERSALFVCLFYFCQRWWILQHWPRNCNVMRVWSAQRLFNSLECAEIHDARVHVVYTWVHFRTAMALWYPREDLFLTSLSFRCSPGPSRGDWKDEVLADKHW